jgi:hypothetical protein
MAEQLDLRGERLRLVADVYGPAEGPPALLHGFGDVWL